MIDSFEFTSAFCREISQHLPRRKVPQLDGIAMICFFQVVLFCSRNEVEIRNSKKVPEGCRKHSPQSQWFLRFKEDLPGCKQEILEATPSTRDPLVKSQWVSAPHMVDGQNPLINIVEVQK